MARIIKTHLGEDPVNAGEKRLLDKGGLARLRGLEDGDVLSLGKEVPKESHVLFPADKLVTGHILRKRERGVHSGYSAGDSWASTGASASASSTGSSAGATSSTGAG